MVYNRPRLKRQGKENPRTVSDTYGSSGNNSEELAKSAGRYKDKLTGSYIEHENVYRSSEAKI